VIRTMARAHPGEPPSEAVKIALPAVNKGARETLTPCSRRTPIGVSPRHTREGSAHDIGPSLRRTSAPAERPAETTWRLHSVPRGLQHALPV
jgi:hypothetical protein